MTRAKRFLLALLVSVVAVSEIASAAEWSVWDGLSPPESRAASPPSLPPVKGLELPLLLPLGRDWLPELAEQSGRLQYIGQMRWAAEGCLGMNDRNFAEADLSMLDRLWETNAKGLSNEELWSVRYGVMHHTQGGGSAISNASCADAKAWLLQDRPGLMPDAVRSAR